MERLLVIPAAGLGSRLGAHTPKLLAQVDGRPMLDHLLSLYAGVVDRVALVVHPAARGAVMQVLGESRRSGIDLFVQEQPTGMLDAILLARSAIDAARPRRVWITWCDQVAIHPRTVARLVEADAGDPLVALPTCTGPEPYVHLARGASGRIVRVLHRREGDVMPAIGESDAGLFSLSLTAYVDLLGAFAAAPTTGTATGERNFLPFIPWASERGTVVTFPCTENSEAVGVNTPDDLAVVERTLRQRAMEAT
jgi:bifunctional UDP-N-acetylglucosamine pyrophosphorylase/glucosamine-1-phosphate N-acetyltransferase